MDKKQITTIAVTAAVVTLLGLAWYNREWLSDLLPGSSNSQGVSANLNNDNITVAAENLEIPWGMAFLPNGDMLVTERSGTLHRIGSNQQTYDIYGVEHQGEGGLLGVALHPNFAQNNTIYLYLTTRVDEGLINRVESYTLKNNQLTNKKQIIGGIPGALTHDGGRIAFGPDNKLYITTGDAGNADLSQDKFSLAGKILRLNADGSIPKNNPFSNAVWSYGHRNPQGLTWDDEDQLWATEHGHFATDELNKIKKGANYGWPVITGDKTQAGMETPVVHSGTDYTWAPSGLVYYNGSFFIGGLVSEALIEVREDSNGEMQVTRHFENDFGRLRGVRLGPDNQLFVSTSNQDGRGSPQPNDDKVLQINPELLLN